MRVVHTPNASFWIDERSAYTAFTLEVPGRTGGTTTTFHVALTPEEAGQLGDALRDHHGAPS